MVILLNLLGKPHFIKYFVILTWMEIYSKKTKNFFRVIRYYFIHYRQQNWEGRLVVG
jgi:hypothetical protein